MLIGNKLDLLDRFNLVLTDYHISKDSEKTLARTELILMVGASSAGRNTVIRELLRTGDYFFIVSDTTRKPRLNDGVLERDGVEYWFRNEKDVLEDLLAGKFLEAEVLHKQQVSGISIRELSKAHDALKIAITDVDMGGVHNIVAAKPDTIAIMMLPPSFEVWQSRMSARGEMAPEEQRRRIETAVEVFKAGLTHEYFTFIISEDVQESVKEIQHIAKTRHAYADSQKKARLVLQELLHDTKAWLEQNGSI